MTAPELHQLTCALYVIAFASLLVALSATWTIKRHGGDKVTVAVESFAYPVALFAGLAAALIGWAAS